MQVRKEEKYRTFTRTVQSILQVSFLIFVVITPARLKGETSGPAVGSERVYARDWIATGQKGCGCGGVPTQFAIFD